MLIEENKAMCKHQTACKTVTNCYQNQCLMCSVDNMGQFLKHSHKMSSGSAMRPEASYGVV